MKRLALVVGVAIGAAALAAGLAYATIPDSAGVIHSCFSQSTGTWHPIDTEASPPQKCKQNEVELDWNKQPAVNTSNTGYVIDDSFPQVNDVADSGGPIGQINLPAGKFVISASVSFNNPGAGQALVECHIEGGTGRMTSGDFGSRYATLDGSVNASNYYAAATIAIDVAVLATTPTTYQLSCSDQGGQVVVEAPGPNMTATQVDNLVSLHS